MMTQNALKKIKSENEELKRKLDQQEHNGPFRSYADGINLSVRLSRVIREEVQSFFRFDGSNENPENREKNDEIAGDFSYPLPRNWPFGPVDRNDMVKISFYCKID